MTYSVVLLELHQMEKNHSFDFTEIKVYPSDVIVPFCIFNN